MDTNLMYQFKKNKTNIEWNYHILYEILSTQVESYIPWRLCRET